MTRREKMEFRAEKRREWAAKAASRAESAHARVSGITEYIPMGQPVLVGHHSERRHRRDLERIDSGTRKAYEEQRKAEQHESRAGGIERQLDHMIFDDDPDAIEALERRIADREREAETYKAINRAWKKGGADAVRAQFGDKVADTAERTMKLAHWLKAPLDATNLRASIRRDRKRLESLRGTSC